MSGTVSGGKAAAIKNKEKYGKDYYARIGARGGRNGRTGGFYYMKANGQIDKVREAGAKGGRVSRIKARVQ